MLEAQLVAQILVGPGLQVLPNKLAGAEQHQAIDQLCSTGAGRGAIDEHQGLLAGFAQVGGDGRAITRCAGDQRVERGAPGVHGGGISSISSSATCGWSVMAVTLAAVVVGGVKRRPARRP